MNEKNLVICDKEVLYANRLAENISEREELNLRVFTCTSLHMVTALMQKIKIHILLVDERYSQEEVAALSVEQILFLTEGKMRTTEEGRTAIFRYQCADHIIQKLLESYMEKTKEDILKRGRSDRTCVEAVYTPIKGIETSEITMLLGKEKSKKKRVLYLNLEEYPGFETEISDENALNLGDLFYYLKQDEEHSGMRIQMVVRKLGAMDYIPAIPVAADLKEVKAEDWIFLLNILKEEGIYDVILLELGESIQGLYEVMKLCDQIYMPVKEDAVSRRRLQNFEKCIEKRGLTSVSQGINRFLMTDALEICVKNLLEEED